MSVKGIHPVGWFVGMALCVLMLGTLLGVKSCQQVKPQTPMCEVPLNCLELPHLNCDGNWTCGQGQCFWECGLEDMPCLTSNDCLDADVCVDTSCPKASCQDDELCPPCWGSCQEEASYSGECGGNMDCGSDKACLLACPPCADGKDCGPCFGKCVDDSPPGYNCQTDDDCDSDSSCKIKICSDNQCPPDDEECESNSECWGYCVEATGGNIPDGMRLNDSDCDDEESCAKQACADAPCNGDPCPLCYGKCVTDKTPEPTQCISTGCSGEICAAMPTVSTCLWKPEYACFKLTECTTSPDGECSWQKSEQFLKCLEEFKGSDSKPPQN